jgi:hypothetical protein
VIPALFLSVIGGDIGMKEINDKLFLCKSKRITLSLNDTEERDSRHNLSTVSKPLHVRLVRPVRHEASASRKSRSNGPRDEAAPPSETSQLTMARVEQSQKGEGSLRCAGK